MLPLNARPKPPNPKIARDTLVELFERDWLSGLYAKCEGDLGELSRTTGMARVDVQKQLKRFGIGEAPAVPKRSR